ncbi:MAG: PCRF domain-containing protein, partial [Bacteroidota bacterium]
MLLDKLEAIHNRFMEVETSLSSPDAMADMKRFAQLNREYKELKPIVEKFFEYRNVQSNLANARELVQTEKDEEFREIAKAELSELERLNIELEETIKILLIPADPEDAKNAIMEIRGGTGGDEASIFAGDLYRMYVRFCERKGWKIETVDFTEG